MSDRPLFHVNTEITMTEKNVIRPGYDQEDAYFHEKDRALLAKRRAELDALRGDPASNMLKCPRCGADMAEVLMQQVKVDRCSGCGGVFLDKGELEILTFAKSDGFFKRLFGRSSSEPSSE
jgi:hypothetical protein